MKYWEGVLQKNSIQKKRIREEIQKLFVSCCLGDDAAMHKPQAFAFSDNAVATAVVLSALLLVTTRLLLLLSVWLCFFNAQAAELDRAEEFKQATEGLALCEQRLTEYNGAAQQLVVEKEVRCVVVVE